MKPKTKIGKALQLNKKWVRLMLTISILAVIGLSIYPDKGIMFSAQQAEEMEQLQEDRLERMKRLELDSMAFEKSLQGMPDMSNEELAEASEELDKAIADFDNAIEVPARSPASVELDEVPVLAQKEPFDWKGAISWGIGAANAVVLLMVNIKNLRSKKA